MMMPGAIVGHLAAVPLELQVALGGRIVVRTDVGHTLLVTLQLVIADAALVGILPHHIIEFVLHARLCKRERPPAILGDETPQAPDRPVDGEWRRPEPTRILRYCR